MRVVGRDPDSRREVAISRGFRTASNLDECKGIIIIIVIIIIITIYLFI